MEYPTTGPEVYTDIRLPNQAFGERKYLEEEEAEAEEEEEVRTY